MVNSAEVPYNTLWKFACVIGVRSTNSFPLPSSLHQKPHLDIVKYSSPFRRKKVDCFASTHGLFHARVCIWLTLCYFWGFPDSSDGISKIAK